MKRNKTLRPKPSATTGISRALDILFIAAMSLAFFLAVTGEFYSSLWVDPDNFWVEHSLLITLCLFPPFFIVRLATRNKKPRPSGFLKSKALLVVLMTVGFSGFLSSFCFFGTGIHVGVADETSMTEKGIVYIGRDGSGPSRNIRRELSREEYYRRKSYVSGFGFGMAVFFLSVMLADRMIKKEIKR